MFSKLLAATETPLYCIECVRTAFRIAERHDAKVFLLHVLESETPLYRIYVRHFRSGKEIVANNAYIREVEKELRVNCSSAGKFWENCEIKVKPGLPWEEILKLARDKNVDLILMNPRSRRAEGEGVGSTVGAVIRRERCPVMIVNQFPSKEQLQFKTLMACIDFSASCLHALAFAVKLAQVYTSKINLFHVLQTGTTSERKQKALMQETRNTLEDLGREIPGRIPRETVIWEGSQPHLEILRAAREKDVDMIVMGSHTKATGTQWYVGSVAERVSSRSACPVSVVTDPKAIKRWKESKSRAE
jgi:nucleotide-binding universal stress UspA family protein